MTIEATNKSASDYTAVQVALILAAVEANGGVADGSVAESLAKDSRMDAGPDAKQPGPRSKRAIIAKMTRMSEIDYVKATPVSKSGGVPTKKTALVEMIAELSGLSASKLTGLDGAPKLALETIRDFVRQVADERAAAWAEAEAQAA